MQHVSKRYRTENRRRKVRRTLLFVLIVFVIVCIVIVILKKPSYGMIPMFFVGWIIMTIVLKNTEEKWLLDLYGKEYADYKKRVNRCIPWKRKR